MTMPKSLVKCDACNKFKPNVTRELSRSSLVFGMSYGRVTFENRCSSCERELARKVTRLFK